MSCALYKLYFYINGVLKHLVIMLLPFAKCSLGRFGVVYTVLQLLYSAGGAYRVCRDRHRLNPRAPIKLYTISIFMSLKYLQLSRTSSGCSRRFRTTGTVIIRSVMCHVLLGEAHWIYRGRCYCGALDWCEMLRNRI